MPWVKSLRPVMRPARHGFSLVEVMVVLVIVGLLAGMVAIGTRGYLARAKQGTARAEIATIGEALETYYLAHDRYPTHEEGLDVLTTTSERWPEPLLRSAPIDPWGRPYQYNTPGRDGQPYEVLSLGADGRDGGDGLDADLGSWDLKGLQAAGATE